MLVIAILPPNKPVETFHNFSYHCFLIRCENLSIRKGGYIFKAAINHISPINDSGNSMGNFHLRSKRRNLNSMQLSSRAWYSARRKEKKKYFADTAAVLFLNVHIILPKYNCHFHLTISSCVSVRMSRYWALGKFGERSKGVRVARGTAESEYNPKIRSI